MHLRQQFEQMQAVGSAVRPPMYASPFRGGGLSPHVSPFRHPMIMSPHHQVFPHPGQLSAYVSPSILGMENVVRHPLPPTRLHYSPAGVSVKKRVRSRSSSPEEELSYSSDDESVHRKRMRRKQDDDDRSVSPCFGVGNFFPVKAPDDEESIHSDDSSSGSEEEYSGSSCASSSDLEDLRDFIDFDPKFNKAQVTRKKSKSDTSGDALRDFLFLEAARPRKWFAAFTKTAVGPKLAKRAKS